MSAQERCSLHCLKLLEELVFESFFMGCFGCRQSDINYQSNMIQI